MDVSCIFFYRYLLGRVEQSFLFQPVIGELDVFVLKVEADRMTVQVLSGYQGCSASYEWVEDEFSLGA